MEEDNKLKDLFAAYDPELTDDFGFMARLKRNMEAVELVKQHNAAVQRRNKLAVVIAAAAGMVMGIMLAICFPIMESRLSLPSFNVDFLLWGITAIVTTLTAINAYAIALAKLRVK